MNVGRKVAWYFAPTFAFAAIIMLGVLIVFGGTGGGDGVTGSSSDETPGSGGVLNDTAKKAIPKEYLGLVQKAVQDENCGLTESVLAAQLNQESGFNPSAQSNAGAQGIAQFMPGTWPSWGRDENNSGDGPNGSPFDPNDAIPAAARFDCGILKSVQDIPGNKMELMLAGYNAGPGAVRQFRGVPPFSETATYVRVILAQATKWTDQALTVADPAKPDGRIELTGDSQIDTAIAWAVDQIGSFYHFGGDCTDPFSDNIAHRCDCSSLMQQAYLHAGIQLPRTAHEQSRVGSEVSGAISGRQVVVQALRPGDLVATIGEDGIPAAPGHIGMYVGGGNVVEAPFEGRQVHLFPVDKYHDVVNVRRIVKAA